MTAVAEELGFGTRVLRAALWRSGSQALAQLVTWSATFFVIRLLDPADYGLFALSQTVLVLLGLLTGWGFTTALVQAEKIETEQVRQVFGLLILLNGALAAIQILLAPLAADYYNQPMVAHLLRVQALIYLAEPFIALPTALLSREMEFRRQAMANFASAFAGAGTALFGALAGLGVWTLAAAPIALFFTRAIGLTIAAWPMLVRPSFRFKGAAKTISFGGAMIAVQFLWFLQSQSDVFIGGRVLDPHQLGLYTTALFLALIVTSKFIPPLNEVAFSAYARLQNDPQAIARSFERACGIIMMVALPFFFGMATTAEPLVRVLLGEKWIEAAPLVATLALAMPFVTLQILFGPAVMGTGRSRLAVSIAGAGALIMPVGFMIGIRHGAAGMAATWLVTAPLFALVTAALAMPAIGVTVRGLARAIGPGLFASAAMAVVVVALDRSVAWPSDGVRLIALVGTGMASYAAVALLVARDRLTDMLRLVIRREA
jgi:O-antigen/teichoic acid export membrane protein